MPSVVPSSALKVLTSKLAVPRSVGEAGALLMSESGGGSTSGGPNSNPKPHSSGFHEKDGKAYCRKDYFDMFAPKCGGCARAILENYISALNTLWHPECFVCRVRSPLPPHWEGTGSGHRGEKGLPHCAPWIQFRGLVLCY